MADDLGAKHEDLMARITAAKRRLAEENRMEWAEIGNILEGLSRDIEQAEGHEPALRASTYSRIEDELAALHERLPGGTEKP